MTMPHRRPMPTWFLIVFALVYGWLLRQQAAAAPVDPLPMTYAWFAWVVIIAELIWSGVQVAAQLTLVFLQWLVAILWVAVQEAFFALREIGQAAINGFRASWDFFRATYENIIRPALEKFWTWVDQARQWLTDLFKPVFEFLASVRAELLKFYDTWVKPILDTIDIARKLLGVLYSLGIDWARTLDQELARLEEKINEPFQFALRQINAIINVIDRIVTADGLFQRLALVRSIGRDIAYVHQEYLKVSLKDLSPTEIAKRHAAKYPGNDPAVPGSELAKLYKAHDGQYAAVVAELVPTWRISAGIDTSPPRVD